jgi:hypothetical protein
MNPELKKRILSNPFVDQIRISMKFDEDAYNELRKDLRTLASSLKGSATIDRELMLSLYSMPVLVRNSFLSFAGRCPLPEIAAKLEDAWVELDELVTKCLAE